MEKIKIKINPASYIVTAIALLLGYWQQFLIITISTTIHELAHILTAIIFKCKIKQIKILPLGEIAEIKDLENIKLWKKIIVILAGPLTNLIIAIILNIFFNKIKTIQFIINVNLVLCFFNIVPIYPLDGGRLFSTICGEYIGILNSIAIVIKASKISSILLIIIGIIQVILYPYNLSLFLVGTYIMSINKKEQIALTYTFFKTIEQKNINIEENKIYPVKTIIVAYNTDIKKIIKKITYNYYHVIYILKEGNIIETTTETKLISHVLKKGMKGIITDTVSL